MCTNSLVAACQQVKPAQVSVCVCICMCARFYNFTVKHAFRDTWKEIIPIPTQFKIFPSFLANNTKNSKKSWISFLNNRDDGKNTHKCAGLFKPEDLKTLNHQKIYVVILFQHWMILFLPLSSFFVCVSMCVFVCHPLSSVCMCDIHNVINSPATFQVTIFWLGVHCAQTTLLSP